jgi:hypothetical protein
LNKARAANERKEAAGESRNIPVKIEFTDMDGRRQLMQKDIKYSVVKDSGTEQSAKAYRLSSRHDHHNFISVIFSKSRLSPGKCSAIAEKKSAGYKDH